MSSSGSPALAGSRREGSSPAFAKLGRARLAPLALAVGVALWVAHAPFVAWAVFATAVFVGATVYSSGLAQNVFLSLASVCVVVVIIEFVALACERVVVRHEDEGFNVARLAVGWGPRAPGRYEAFTAINGRAAFDVHYTVDDRLFRATRSGTEGPATAFFGDSFMFGVGLDDDQTLPQLFADREGRRHPVFNLAMGGYNPAQVLATMETGFADDLIARSELLVQFVAPWHAERTACRPSWQHNAPRYAVIDGAVTYDGICPHHIIDVLENSSFYRTFVEPRLPRTNNAELELFTRVVEQTIRLSREKYHKPMIVYYLSEPAFLKGTAWTDEAIIDRFVKAGAKVLSYNMGDGADPKYKLGDGHPSFLSNQVRAARLADFIKTAFPDSETAKALAPTP